MNILISFLSLTFTVVGPTCGKCMERWNDAGTPQNWDEGS